MALKKKGQLFKFVSERGGYSERRASLRKEGFPTLEETMIYVFMRPHVVVLLFIVIFYAKTSMQYVLII